MVSLIATTQLPGDITDGILRLVGTGLSPTVSEVPLRTWLLAIYYSPRPARASPRLSLSESLVSPKRSRGSSLRGFGRRGL